MQRRVILLETDERAGLVAALADTCSQLGVSLEISTGIGHVLISFDADDSLAGAVAIALQGIGGVAGVHPYAVLAA
jgi:hypothetical protein